MKIKQATISDAALIAEYNVALAQESENLALDPALVRKGVESVLCDSAKGVYFGAYDNDRIVGLLMVTYEWSDWRNGNIWWLQSVYVHPDYRSRGVFKSIYAHVVEQAKKNPEVCGFRLYVDAENKKAQDVYYRLEFEKTNYQVLEKMLERKG